MIIEAIYVGGPLDGQSPPQRVTGGPWALYRADNGLPLPSGRGHTQMHRFNAGKQARRMYVLNEQRTVQTVNGEKEFVTYVDYVHTTVIHEYRKRPPREWS